MADVALVARTVALAGAAVLVIAALCLRGRESWTARHPRFSGFLSGLAMVTGGAAWMWLLDGVLRVLPRDVLIAGPIVGLMFGGIAVALALPVVLLLAIIDRGSLPRVEDPSLLVWTGLAASAGCAVTGILLLQFFSLLEWSGAWAFLFVPFGLALFPFGKQLFWAPALMAALRRRQSRLEPTYAGSLREWCDRVSVTYRTGTLDVLFGPASEAGAAAIGFWPFTRFIMIGDGLTSVMPEREVRAILAHEVAHVLRSDVRNQLALWLALGTLWVYVWVAISMSLGLRGPVWAFANGLGIGLMMMLTARYSRHCELMADRLAEELIDDPGAMAAALTRFAEMTRTPAGQRFPTHPSLNDRLASLRAARSTEAAAHPSR